MLWSYFQERMMLITDRTKMRLKMFHEFYVIWHLLPEFDMTITRSSDDKFCRLCNWDMCDKVSMHEWPLVHRSWWERVYISLLERQNLPCFLHRLHIISCFYCWGRSRHWPKIVVAIVIYWCICTALQSLSVTHLARNLSGWEILILDYCPEIINICTCASRKDWSSTDCPTIQTSSLQPGIVVHQTCHILGQLETVAREVDSRIGPADGRPWRPRPEI